MEVPEGPTEDILAPGTMFALAQHSVVSLWHQRFAERRAAVLWVPSYFCPPVVETWSHAGIAIRRFADDPRWQEPDWRTLEADADDLVLAVNYFGVRDALPWDEWSDGHPHVEIVEDHSHDPWSSWARASRAHFAFASLRKTVPVPDGAIFWSPRDLALPPPPRCDDWSGSALKLAGMTMKSEYLRGGTVPKDSFRALLQQGESLLISGEDLVIAPWSEALIRSGVPRMWRKKRETNIRRFWQLFERLPGVEAIHTATVDGHCPLNAVLLFDDRGHRDAVRRKLMEQRVYAAVHWPQPSEENRRVRETADRVLTIPLDQRYDESDVRRVARIAASILDEVSGRHASQDDGAAPRS